MAEVPKSLCFKGLFGLENGFKESSNTKQAWSLFMSPFFQCIKVNFYRQKFWGHQLICVPIAMCLPMYVLHKQCTIIKLHIFMTMNTTKPTKTTTTIRVEN